MFYSGMVVIVKVVDQSISDLENILINRSLMILKQVI